VTPADGVTAGCSVTVTILACTSAIINCATVASPLRAPWSSCSQVVLAQTSLFNATGGLYTVSPALPAGMVFAVGSYGPYTVAPQFGSNPSCQVPAFSVAACPTNVTCTSQLTVQLAASGGCSSTAALQTSALYTASGAVTVSPALPGSMQFGPGNYTYTVAGADGVNSCVARLSVKACPTVTCAAPLSVQLPQPAGDCTGAVVAASALYSASAAVTLTPTLQSKYSPSA
jgi:hypothetical protein